MQTKLPVAFKALMRVTGTIAGALVGIWLVSDYTSGDDLSRIWKTLSTPRCLTSINGSSPCGNGQNQVTNKSRDKQMKDRNMVLSQGLWPRLTRSGTRRDSFYPWF
jgi:hypothetical protein